MTLESVARGPLWSYYKLKEKNENLELEKWPSQRGIIFFFLSFNVFRYLPVLVDCCGSWEDGELVSRAAETVSWSVTRKGEKQNSATTESNFTHIVLSTIGWRMYLAASCLWRFCSNLRIVCSPALALVFESVSHWFPSAKLPGLEVQRAGPPWSGAFGSGGQRLFATFICIHLPINPSVYLSKHISTCLSIRWLWSQSQTGLNSSAAPCLLLSESGQGS